MSHRLLQIPEPRLLNILTLRLLNLSTVAATAAAAALLVALAAFALSRAALWAWVTRWGGLVVEPQPPAAEPHEYACEFGMRCANRGELVK